MDGYFEMTKQEMMATVYRQLALDYNCQPRILQEAASFLQKQKCSKAGGKCHLSPRVWR